MQWRYVTLFFAGSPQAGCPCAQSNEDRTKRGSCKTRGLPRQEDGGVARGQQITRPEAPEYLQRSVAPSGLSCAANTQSPHRPGLRVKLQFCDANWVSEKSPWFFVQRISTRPSFFLQKRPEIGKMPSARFSGSDRAVMVTSDDAAVSKLSAVQKGYYQVFVHVMYVVFLHMLVARSVCQANKGRCTQTLRRPRKCDADTSRHAG